MIDTLPLEDKSIEVIVVDNASKEDEATFIEQHYPQVKVIRSKENLGFAGGNNLGIKAARGKYFFFLNNDTILKHQTSDIRHQTDISLQPSAFSLQPLINRLESSPKIGVVCPKICFAWGNNLIQFAGFTPLSQITLRNQSIGCGETDHGQYNTAHPTPYAHGAAMMVKREVIEKVGLMPECYFLYYEELDWSMMIRRADYDIMYDPACTIYHKESQTTGQSSPLKSYYMTRNRFLFAKRNINGPKKIVTYLYLTGVVALRDIMKYTLRRRVDLAKATFNGILGFIHYKERIQHRTL